MRRVLTLALVGAFALCVSPVVRAQNFPDAPENHWAYDALLGLKQAGLLVGYPDGLFKGYRPLSRYEYAVAAWAAYQKLQSMFQASGQRLDTISAQIDEINRKIGIGGGTGDTGGLEAQLTALRQQLDELKTDTAALAGMKDEIASLKKLFAEFEKDIAALGVDAGEMKRGLDSLTARVTALEKIKPAYTLTGDFNAIGVGGYSLDHLQGVNWTGNPVGTNSLGQPTGIENDLEFAMELGLGFNGTLASNIGFHSDLVIGSIAGYEFDSMSQMFPGQRKSADRTDVFVNRMYFDWGARALGNPVNIQMGRIGYKAGPWVMQRVDVDPYLDIARYDNGEWGFDGGLLNLNFSTVSLDLFGGKQANRGSTNSTSVQRMLVGDNRTIFDFTGRPAGVNQGLLDVETELGANLGMNFAGSGKFNLAYVVLDGPTTTAAPSLGNPGFLFNRVGVLGGGMNLGFGESLFLSGNFAQTQMMYNGSSRLNKDNFAYDIGVKLLKGEQYDFGVSYRETRPFFAAPGDWGRIGFWHNPTDLKGFLLGGNYQFNPTLDITVSGEFYQGTGRARDSAGTVVGLSSDDKLNRIQLGFGYKLTSRWKVLVGWEGVYWDLKGRAAGFRGQTQPFFGAKPKENYYTLGFNWGLGATTGLRFIYQISDYDGKGLPGFNTPSNGDTRAKGGLIVTQFSLDF